MTHAALWLWLLGAPLVLAVIDLLRARSGPRHPPRYHEPRN